MEKVEKKRARNDRRLEKALETAEKEHHRQLIIKAEAREKAYTVPKPDSRGGKRAKRPGVGRGKSTFYSDGAVPDLELGDT